MLAGVVSVWLQRVERVSFKALDEPRTAGVCGYSTDRCMYNHCCVMIVWLSVCLFGKMQLGVLCSVL